MKVAGVVCNCIISEIFQVKHIKSIMKDMMNIARVQLSEHLAENLRQNKIVTHAGMEISPLPLG